MFVIAAEGSSDLDTLVAEVGSSVAAGVVKWRDILKCRVFKVKKLVIQTLTG